MKIKLIVTIVGLSIMLSCKSEQKPLSQSSENPPQQSTSQHVKKRSDHTTNLSQADNNKGSENTSKEFNKTKESKTEDRPPIKLKETPKKKPLKTIENRKKVKPKPVLGHLVFPDTLFDFGFIDEGDTIRHSFRFINDGNANFEIVDVQVSCGCTVPTYSFQPIEPGRLSKIDVMYLSEGKGGSQLAIIDIKTTAKNASHRLYLKGVVR